MKPEHIFGTAPEGFKAAIASAIDSLKEDAPMKRPNYRLVVVMTVLILAIAGVVYAAATEWKLLTFFQERYEMNLADETIEAIGQNTLNQSITLSGITFTFQDAIADGRYIYATVKAMPDPALSAYLMEPGTGPADPMVFGGKYDRDNSQSFQRAAEKEGKRLFTAQVWVDAPGYEVLGGYTEGILQQDGSLTMILGMELPLPAEVAGIDMKMTAFVAEWVKGSDGVYEQAEPIRETLSFSMPVALPTANLSIPINQVVPGTAAHIDTLTLTMTPLSCYYEIAYTALETEDTLLNAHTRNVLFFDILDEKGNILPFGLSMSAGKDSKDDTHYVQSGCFQVTSLPAAITLAPGESWGGGPEDTLTIPIQWE